MLGGDDDHAISCFRTVEGGSIRTLEDGHAFDVVRVDIGKGVTAVGGVAAGEEGISNLGTLKIRHRDTVHDDERLVLAQNGFAASELDLR